MEFPDTLTIDITQDDIDHGKRQNCKECPAALAVIRILPYGDMDIDMCNTTLYVDYGQRDKFGWFHDFVMYNNPVELANFIRAFDKKGPVEPGTFTLTLETK